MMRWFPEAASTYAGDLDWLFLLITIIVGVWFIAAELLLVYAAVKFRRKEGVRAAYLPGRSLRAMSVVLIPCAIVLCLDLVIDGVAAPVWHNIKEKIPESKHLVRITGGQWFWQFTLPGADGKLDTADDVTSVNELHVPAGEIVQFELTAKDVLHSFFVPQLRLKQDAIPGRRIRGWFEVTKTGKFEIVCAEICGLLHTNMRGTMVAESPEAYQKWLQSLIPPVASTPQEEGEEG